MAKKGGYDWSAPEPPRVSDHSLVKHQLIADYLRRYVPVLTADPRVPQLRITLIDGFAGGGRYRDAQGRQQPGSPIVMANAMRDAAVDAQLRRRNPFTLDAEYHFIEADPDAVTSLRVAVDEAGLGALVGTTVRIKNSRFENEYRPIIAHLQRRRGRSIFLLDQYGYNDVPLSMMRELLSELPNAEIILTFAVDSLIDYISDTPAFRKAVGALDDGFPVDEILRMKAVGQERFVIQRYLHRLLVERTGAKYFTPFFIRSMEAHRDYWLVHLSGHSKARDVMAQVHWQHKTCRFVHHGGPGLNMLGHDPCNPHSQASFDFDDHAEKQTLSALGEQLPRLVRSKHGDGVKLSDLYASIANETPASTTQVSAALAHCVGVDIEIRGPGGGAKRVLTIGPRDIIFPKRQLVFPISAQRRRGDDG